MSGLRLRLAVIAATLLIATAAQARTLRVCADPNNLPFSSQAREGFENRIMERVARHLGAKISYTWWAQRRGNLRHTLKADRCDVVPGVPTSMDTLLTTAPYYRSTYVFVTRAGEPVPAGLDDPMLREREIGVQLIGDDGTNSPPAMAMGRRHIVRNVRGFTVYGDYAKPNPPAAILRAVADGEVDIATVWGPLAGYFAPRQNVPLVLTPMKPLDTRTMIPMSFDISMGVRRGEMDLRDELNAAISDERAAIDAILAEYHVPRTDRTRIGKRQ